MKRIFSFLMALSLVLTLFTGCGKDKSPTTEELMEKYGDGTYVSVDEMPMVYLYGEEDSELRNQIINYNYGHQEKLNQQFRYILCNDLPLDQFGTKIQTEMMSGTGPDLIFTRQSAMFSDINKVIASGAFGAWDAYESDLDSNRYYTKMLDGVYSPDGKHYLLPLNVSMQYVVTSKTNLQKYGLPVEDLADFGKMTDALYRLWQTTDADVYPIVITTDHYRKYIPTLTYNGDLDFTAVMPEILDYQSQKTALSDESNRLILEKWGEMLALAQKRRDDEAPNIPKSILHGILSGTVIMEIMSQNQLTYYLYENTQWLDEDEAKEQLSDLVILPLCDTQGRIVADIDTYAVMSANAKGEDALAGFIKWFAEGEYEGNLLLSEPYLNQESTIEEFNIQYGKDYTEGVFSGEILHEMIKDAEWNLRVPNDSMKEFNTEIMDCMSNPDTADWEELERSINIYLSE